MNNSGWSADKYLGTDSYGNVVVKDAPEGSGAAVTVDAEMSDTSINPVQNKVVKAYVDDAITGAWLGVY